VRKVWRQLRREGFDRCTVAQLIKKMALQGVIRGRRVRTTVAASPPAAALFPRSARYCSPAAAWD
jgi:hypothetical protein